MRGHLLLPDPDAESLPIKPGEQGLKPGEGGRLDGRGWGGEKVEETTVAEHVAGGGGPEDILAGGAPVGGVGGEDLGDWVKDGEAKEGR